MPSTRGPLGQLERRLERVAQRSGRIRDRVVRVRVDRRFALPAHGCNPESGLETVAAVDPRCATVDVPPALTHAAEFMDTILELFRQLSDLPALIKWGGY